MSLGFDFLPSCIITCRFVPLFSYVSLVISPLPSFRAIPVNDGQTSKPSPLAPNCKAPPLRATTLCGNLMGSSPGFPTVFVELLLLSRVQHPVVRGEDAADSHWRQ